MVIIIYDSYLHNPMYFFLWNLSILDLCISSVVVPKMLFDFLSTSRTISIAGCFSQIFFFHFFGSTEAVLVSVMSYDRYMAIGNPLRYVSIMTPKVCLHLALTTWAIGFFHSLLHTVMTSKLLFCGHNLVEHFFCDIRPVLNLSCTDITLNLKLLTLVTGNLVLATFLLTLLSYILIIKCLIKIKTTEGRKHAFSTCSAHLTVVLLQYGSVIFSYGRSSSGASLDQDRAAGVIIAAFIPTLNPIIYTLRNKDLKRAFKKMTK
ncbi:hypothetical protein GDO86_016431 [Hymenochirus boettgeri]|uniref:Olfactory receptor n=1 Tax=Hymenochirus boettgeri TaxID=247094 RepID=A0A8T2K573_9PIPI|nr:hypothetical protein GDO86_016431 [Hymenochirus boettgeri]